MAGGNLEIVLVLNDKATKKLQESLKEMGFNAEETTKIINKLHDEGEKKATKHKSSLIEAKNAVQSFRKEMFVLGVAIASAGFAITEYANRNLQTRDSLRELQVGMKNMTAMIGAALSPIIVGLAEVTRISFDSMKEMFRNLQIGFAALMDGFVYGFTFYKNIMKGIPAAMQAAEAASKSLSEKMANTFVATIPSIETAQTKLKDMADIVSSLNTRFLAGEINSTVFYEGINSKANNVIGTNTIIAQQLKELHENQLMANNIELQDAVNKNQEYIALSKFRQQEHATATQGMMALTMQLGQSIQQNLSNALSGLITGALTAKQAFQ